jgi:nucleoside diphosphate kinase
VGIKVLHPTKEFAKQHYHDLKERPFFDGLCDFLSSGPVIAMVRNDSISGLMNQSNKLVFMFLICVFCSPKIMS